MASAFCPRKLTITSTFSSIWRHTHSILCILSRWKGSLLFFAFVLQHGKIYKVLKVQGQQLIFKLTWYPVYRRRLLILQQTWFSLEVTSIFNVLTLIQSYNYCHFLPFFAVLFFLSALLIVSRSKIIRNFLQSFRHQERTTDNDKKWKCHSFFHLCSSSPEIKLMTAIICYINSWDISCSYLIILVCEDCLCWDLIPNGTCTGSGQNRIESGLLQRCVLKILVSLLVHFNIMTQYSRMITRISS